MKKFKKVYLEITNVCNLACDFCPPTMRQPEFMETKVFSRILDQIKPYSNYIYLHVKGEPLLHPKIDELLDISYNKDFKVNVTTNGTLIDKVKDNIIKKSALRQVNFSLHSLSGNEGYDDFSEYLENIFTFIREINVKNDTIISLRLWNLDEDNLTNMTNKTNDKLLEGIEKEFALNYKIQEKITHGYGIKIAHKVYLNQDQEFQWPALNEEEDDGVGFCYGLRNQIAILVDGTVVPCCLDGEGVINLGNINNMDFREIVEGARTKDIYHGFSRRYAAEELCRKCGYRKRFDMA